MPITINNFNYSDPVDNKNILYLDTHLNTLANEPEKAFRIIGNIWVIPDRFSRDSNPNLNKPPRVTSPKSGYYDPNYLSTDSEKDTFLKEIIKLFKRINSREIGEELIYRLATDIPFPGNNNTPINTFDFDVDFNSVDVKTRQGNNWVKTGSINPSVIITGPRENIIDPETSTFKLTNNTFAAQEGFGALSIISISPRFMLTYSNATNNVGEGRFSKSEFCMDPILILMHELNHTMHNLYGIAIPNDQRISSVTSNIFYSQYKVKLEYAEIYAFGGPTIDLIPKSGRKYFEEKALDYYRSIAKRLNSITTANPSSFNKYIGEYKQKLIRKYRFVVESSGEVAVDRNKFAELYKELTQIFTEFNYAKIYNVQNRKIYLSNVYTPVTANILDDNVYDIQNGFNIPKSNLNVLFMGQNLSRNPALRKVNPENMLYLFTKFCHKAIDGRSLYNKTLDCRELLVKNTDLPFIGDISDIKTDIFLSKDINVETEVIDYPDNVSVDQVILSKNTSEHGQLDLLYPIIEGESQVLPGENQVFYDNRTQNVDYLNSYYYLESQKLSDNVEDFTFTTSIEEALDNSGKVYTYFPKLADKVNTGVQGGLFLMWANDVVEDFTTNILRKDTLDKISDVSAIIPYIGPALNISNSVRRENFTEAFAVTGVTILLEAFQEFTIPALGAFVIYSKVQERNEIIKTIDNCLEQRIKRWKDSYEWMIGTWLSRITTQFNNISYQMYDSLNYQADAIKDKIDLEYKKYSGSDKENIKSQVENLKNSLDIKISEAMNNINKFIRECSVTYLFKNMLPKVIDELNKFDLKTKTELINLIDSHNIILVGEVDRLKAKVNESFENTIPFNIFSYTNNSLLKDIINEYFNSINDSKILSLQNKKNALVDTSGYNAEVRLEGDVQVNTIYTNDFKLSSSGDKIIVNLNNNILYSAIYENSSVSFWIKISKDLTNSHNEYTIINSIKQNSGWKLCIRNGNIEWILQDINRKYKSLIFDYSESLSHTGYTNKWFFVTITNNIMGYMKLYINGELKQSERIEDLNEVKLDKTIVFGIDENIDENQMLWIRDFNIFSKELSNEDINIVYEGQILRNVIKDYWGNPLKFDTEYYIINDNYIDRYIAPKSNILVLVQYPDRSKLYTGNPITIKSVSDKNPYSRILNGDNIMFHMLYNSGKYMIIRDTDTIYAIEGRECSKNCVYALKLQSNLGNYGIGIFSIKNIVSQNKYCSQIFSSFMKNTMLLADIYKPWRFSFENAYTPVAVTNYETKLLSTSSFWKFISRDPGWVE
uniref:Neurotoxin n=1 Tax=Clostridium botulinum C TaxID=36828 RepID=Q45849_CLOBO|nr:neurotoxin [Clostridium botulinum C]